MSLLDTRLKNRKSISSSARIIALVRILLLTIACATIAFSGIFDIHFLSESSKEQSLLRACFINISYVLYFAVFLCVVFAFLVKKIKSTKTLAFWLILDVLWSSFIVYFTGGILSTSVVMLFIIVVLARLRLPSTIPFLFSTLSALLLSFISILYLSNNSPFPPDFVEKAYELFVSDRVLTNLLVQITALYLVEFLGLMLSRTQLEQNIVFSDMIEQLGEGVFVYNKKGDVLYVNKEAFSLLELPPNIINVNQIQKDKQDFLNLEDNSSLKIIKNNKHLRVWKKVLLNKKKKVIANTIRILDETKRVMLEQKAGKAKRLAQLGEMAAGIAHEVKNPLASLRGCSQEIHSIVSEDTIEQKMSKIMIKECDRISEIVDSFLTLAKNDEPAIVSINLKKEISEIVTLLEKRKDYDAEVIVENTSTTEPQIDQNHFKQIMMNILINSLNAMKKTIKPLVFITITEEKKHIVIEVKDNGIGIEQTDLDKIFVPFFSSSSKGTGLGLSITKQLIDMNNCNMKINSEGKNKGTVVEIIIPIGDSDE